MSSTCPRCGEENKEEAKFCNGCGSSLIIDPQDLDPTDLLSSDYILIERYRIEELIKSGGMGAVYKGYDLRLNKLCAIKELLKLSLSTKERQVDIKRFEREANILATLHHKYLPRVTDYFAVENKYYLVMDFVEGYDLNIILSREGNPGLPEDKVILWMLQTCEVLDYLHNQSPPIIYRDVKPSNIMINAGDGTIRLVDFGIARSIEPDYYTSNTVIGTLGYAPLEQYQGKADFRSDIYALGATMHHLLTGQKPIPFDFKPLKDVNPAISERLHNIVMKSLSAKPNDRFQTAKEFQEVLSGKGEIAIGDARQLKQVEILIMQLSIPNYELKKLAIKSLVDLKAETAIMPLIDTFKNDEDWRIRKEALLALENFNDKNIIKALCDRLSIEEHTEVKAHIIRVLGEIKAVESIDLLLNGLDSPVSDIKWRSVVALGNMGDKKALEPLFTILKDESGEFRDDARASIEMIDPHFLKSWYQSEEIKKNKLDEKNTIKTIFVIGILLIISLMLFKFFSQGLTRYNINNRLESGKAYFASKDYKKALALFNEVIKLNPNEAEGYYNLGLVYLTTKENAKAMDSMEKAVKFDKNNPLYKIGLARTYIAGEKISLAITSLEKVIEFNKNIAEGYLYLGEAYYKKGDIKEALKNFNYCIDNFPHGESSILAANWIAKLTKTDNKQNTDELMDEASGYLSQKNYDKAIGIYDEILRKNPREVEAYIGSGMAYYNKNDYDKAEIQFKQVLSMDLNNLKACLILGSLYLKKENYDGSIELTTRIINLDSKNSDAYYIRGIAYHYTGKDEEALNDFRRYLAIDSTSSDAAHVKHWINEIEKKNK